MSESAAGYEMVTIELQRSSERTLSIRPWLLWTGLVVAAGAIGYTAFTGHIWEDYLITFRFSRNWARGNGLVYLVGERIHGFTSFLNVMIPAIADWMYGGESIQPALTVYRAACISALVGAAMVVGRLVRSDQAVPRWAVWLVPLVIVADFKTVAYACNGQETAFVWLFASLAMWSLRSSPAAGWRGFGLSAAGLMYSRPDGFVFAGILGLAAIVLPRGGRADIRGVCKAALLATACYAPWFGWVWSYFGTPVPHTIVAKVHAYGEATNDLSVFNAAIRWLSFALKDAGEVFAPIYANDADWPAWMRPLCFALAGTAALPLVVPNSPLVARRASLAFVLAVAYLGMIHLRIGILFPWYTTFAALAGVVSLVSMLPWAISRRRSLLHAAPIAVAATMLLVGMAVLSFHGWRQIALQQREIEWGVRAQIGRWLAGHAAAGDRVLLEPIGYIGFFSNAALYDYPGLVSPRMVAVRRAGHAGLAQAALALEPEWLVLRRHEALAAAKVDALRERYDVAHEIDVSPRLKRILAGSPYSYYGTGYLAMDCHYIVFRRNSRVSQAAKPGVDRLNEPVPAAGNPRG